MSTDQLTMESEVVTAPSLYKNKSGRHTIVGNDYIIRIFKNGTSILKLEPGVHETEAEEIRKTNDPCSLREVIALYDKIDQEISEAIESLNPFREAIKPTVKINWFFYDEKEFSVSLEKNDFELSIDEDDFWEWVEKNDYNLIPVCTGKREFPWNHPNNSPDSEAHVDWDYFSKDKELMKPALENYLTEKIG